MSIYLVRSLLLSLFIAIFITVCYYFLRKEVSASSWSMIKTRPPSWSADFTVAASRTQLTQQDNAFRKAVQRNRQITEARLQAAKFKYEMLVKNDSTYAVTINSVVDTNRVRHLICTNTHLKFYEVYRIDELVPALKSSVPEMAGYFSVSFPYQETDGRTMYSPYLGSCRAADSAKVRSFFTDPENLSRFPADVHFMFGQQSSLSNSDTLLYLYAIRMNADALSNKYIQQARVDHDVTDEPVLDFLFDAAGALRWEKMTARNIGKPIAMAINDQVLYAPTVMSTITGGNARLQAGNTIESNRILGAMLTSEDLFLPVKLTESRIKLNPRSPAEALSPTMAYALAFCASFAISFCIIWFAFRPGKNAGASPTDP